MRKLLLHTCCGPCSIMPVKRLIENDFQPFLWFMNPNIHPLMEYLRRRENAGIAANKLGVKIIFEDQWDISAWLAKQLPHSKTEKRCENCIAMRMEEAAKTAAAQNIPFFSTSLLYSIYQPHEFIKECGYKLAKEYNLSFIYEDFRRNWQEGIDKSREWNLYRQPYCGCIFSESERYTKKLLKLRKVLKEENGAELNSNK